MFTGFTAAKLAVALIAVSLVAAGGIDLYLILAKIEGDTPSDLILDLLRKYPIIGAGFGVLLGHLLWPQYR